jgi:cyclopropane-fatty-acyl-phospholipid synthase
VIDRLARAIVVRVVSRRVTRGHIELQEPGRSVAFGPRHGMPRALIEIHSPRFWRALLRGSLGLAESYRDGDWTTPDLVRVVRVAALNAHEIDRVRRRLRFVLWPLKRVSRVLSRPTPRRSRRQIAAHYDLGNQLFELFLDETMSYSSAIFPSASATLEEASLTKLDRVCEKLDLRPEDELLEIGSGWGALAVHAAAHWGCRVTTTTISREQHAAALERVRAAGLEDRVTVLLRDYRELEGEWDKVVSIEMIEAVGWQYLDTYFKRCSDLLAPHGAMLLQAIVMDDRAYEVEKASKSFINTYIFPGGCLPSIAAISDSVKRCTDLRAVHLEDITAHYAETLRRWRERFLANAERAAELGYDTTFRRLWEFYLAYSEAGFRERRIADVQLMLAKPDFRCEPLRPLALDALAEAPPLALSAAASG